MLGGIILLILMLIALSITNQYLIITFVFIAGIILLNNSLLERNGAVSRFLYGLERDNFRLGHGAIWLGIGTCFALSYLKDPLALATIGLIFIADSVSPIIGMRYGSVKLPYNKKKSILGTLSYALAAFIVSYFFIGSYAIIIALVGAIIESLPISLDDNFDVPFGIFIISKLFGV